MVALEVQLAEVVLAPLRLCEDSVMKARAAPWLLLVLIPAMAVPFVLLIVAIFGLDWYETKQHVWVDVEHDPALAYVPAGAHLVASSHSGLTMAAQCPEHSKCEYIRTYASPLSKADLRAQVERDLVALGFTRTPTHPSKCAPAFAHAERFARGEISVWPTYLTTPYQVSRSSPLIPTSEGASILQLRIENTDIVWGC